MKTAVGLFNDPQRVNDVVREIEALGFPRNEVRTLEEPKTFEITGVMSFPRQDFEVELGRELLRIGASGDEVQVYVEGLRRGGAVVLATGSDADDKVEAVREIMNQHGAVEVEETRGPEPELPQLSRGEMASVTDSPVLTGRLRQPAGGACLFFW